MVPLMLLVLAVIGALGLVRVAVWLAFRWLGNRETGDEA